MAMPILEARSLRKSFGSGSTQVKVLREASLSVAPGEFVVIMGASGSGKSTMLHLLGALDTPDSGSVSYRGESVFDGSRSKQGAYRNREVGFVFQFYHLLPELNVLENVMLPALVSNSFWAWRKTRVSARQNALEMLDRVGLIDRVKHRPNELSGGEQQRVAISRALVHKPALLLADEPTGNLDATTGSGILNLLAEFSEAGQTMILVTHDASVASRADRTLTLVEGVIREAGAPTAVEHKSEPQKPEVVL